MDYGKCDTKSMNLALYSMALLNLQIDKKSSNAYISAQQLYNIVFQSLELPSLADFIPDICQSTMFKKEEYLNQLLYNGFMANLLGTVKIYNEEETRTGLPTNLKISNLLWKFY